MWIKDFSDIELPAEDKNILERKVHKTQIEEIEREQEKEDVKKEKKARKDERNDDENEEKSSNWRMSKIRNRFK